MAGDVGLEVLPIPPVTLTPLETGQGPVPVPALLPIENDFAAALQTTDFADQHASEADAFIAQLGVLAASIVPPVITPQFPTNTNSPAIYPQTPPTLEPIVYEPPDIPAPFTGMLTVQDVFPEFTAAPPQLLFPNAPSQPLYTTPTQPGLDTNFVYPTVDVVLPAPPDLLSISTYQFDGVTIPTLSATAPVLTAVAPNVTQYVPNAPYTDALLQEVISTLQDRINNGTNTGLPPAIEQNLWDRAREREYKQQSDALAALDRMETLGYAFPPGVYIDAQIKIQTESNYTIAGLERDIAIKQAELIHEDIVKALDTATAIESKLIDYANQTEQRRFETSRYITEAGVSVYNSQVQAYSALVQTYRVAVEIYQAQIQGQLAIVEAYKAEIAAEQLKAEINTSLVQQYKVQVDAALASIQVFQGEIEIVKTQAEVEQLKVSIFGEEVRAYATQINAYTAQVEAYKALLSAEQTKEQVYATQAEVFSTEVSAISKEIDANVEIFKAQLAAKTEEYDAYRAQVESQAEQVKAIAAMNNSTAAIYSAEVSGVSSYNDAIIKAWQASIDEAIHVTQIGVSAAQANAQMYLTVAGIATDAAKVGAQVEAQIAASALGAVTYATHRARQDSVGISASQSAGVSNSNSTTLVASNSTSMSSSATTSDNETDSSTTSSSTAFNHNISSVE
jgi:hypothetical protein